MGTWGEGLYDDDHAADLRDSIALIARIPAPGDRLLEIVLSQHDGGPDLSDDGGPTFWLVIADQFERRGIRCAAAFERALTAIESGFDVKDLESRGMVPKGLAKRRAILEDLAKRFRSPRPERATPGKPRPPDAVVKIGQVYAFPTQDGLPFASLIVTAADIERSNFKPNGWGALLVVDQGRAFDWLPWCALASVSVDPLQRPTLSRVLDGELLYHSQTNGAARCVPKRSELKDVGFELIGDVSLDHEAARGVVAQWPSAEQAVDFGWRLRTAAFGRNTRFKLPRGPKVSALLAAR